MFQLAPLLALLLFGQPAQADNNYEIIMDAGVSAQQLFVTDVHIAYIVDKTENNPAQVAGHPAWATEVNLLTRTARPMDIRTNSFCAAGTALGNGQWINAGGNNPVVSGGQTANTSGEAPYEDFDGGLALRTLDPCTDGSCEWVDASRNYMNSRRWYPTLETLTDGYAAIFGGDQWGGFVNNRDGSQNTPSFEYYPKSRGRTENVNLTFLVDSLPANLYPLTWMVPSGRIFMQAGWMSMLYDLDTGNEQALPNVTKAVRTYPASAATAMLVQSKENNWTAPILMCGGADYTDADWEQQAANNDFFRNHPNSQSCVQISPDDENPTWEDNDDLIEPRSMGNLIALPDGRFFLLNGIECGVAGYDTHGVPYGTCPIKQGAYFDPKAPAGTRWNRDNLQNASLPRLYHSTASLLADGSVLVAGSNPYADFQTNGSTYNAGPLSSTDPVEWWSETRLEIFYPDYYSKPRPAPTNMPASISYGGEPFNVYLSESDITALANASDVAFRVIRFGFSTHALNMGQRVVELETSLQNNGSGATLTVAPLPANPAVLAPGPAFAFVVINGVPSNGTLVMIGSGRLGTQPTAAYPTLAASTFTASAGAVSSASEASAAASASAKVNAKSAASTLTPHLATLALFVLALGIMQ